MSQCASAGETASAATSSRVRRPALRSHPGHFVSHALRLPRRYVAIAELVSAKYLQVAPDCDRVGISTGRRRSTVIAPAIWIDILGRAHGRPLEAVGPRAAAQSQRLPGIGDTPESPEDVADAGDTSSWYGKGI